MSERELSDAIRRLLASSFGPGELTKFSEDSERHGRPSVESLAQVLEEKPEHIGVFLNSLEGSIARLEEIKRLTSLMEAAYKRISLTEKEDHYRLIGVPIGGSEYIAQIAKELLRPGVTMNELAGYAKECHEKEQFRPIALDEFVNCMYFLERYLPPMETSGNGFEIANKILAMIIDGAGRAQNTEGLGMFSHMERNEGIMRCVHAPGVRDVSYEQDVTNYEGYFYPFLGLPSPMPCLLKREMDWPHRLHLETYGEGANHVVFINYDDERSGIVDSRPELIFPTVGIKLMKLEQL